MKFSYKFSNLLGTVYHKGNLLFTGNGNTLISPVGNRITLYHLKENKTETLPIESRYNFTTLALSPNGCILIAVNDAGEALFCSLISKTVVQRFHFHQPIQDVKFSPDGKCFAVTKENSVFLYRAPGPMTEFNSIKLVRSFNFSYDRTLCIDWSSDSRVIAVGGDDMTTKVYPVQSFKNMSICTLGSHNDSVVGCFFEDNSLDMYTVGKNGQVCVWDCNLGLEELVEGLPFWKNKAKQPSNDDDNDKEANGGVTKEKEEDHTNKSYYKRAGRHFIMDVLNKKGYVALTSCAYHKKSHLLVSGFSNGSFLLHEMPDCTLIHSLSISSQMISGLAFNSTGDWIALGCFGVGQLVVWEWQSESFVLKQQGHFNSMKCLSYSPDGMFILTGGEDGKVKLWNTSTGFCVVTKDDHSAAISNVTFAQNGKIFLSASSDGTVRAFDMLRYRNFRTFTSPRPTQFSCLTVDPSSDMVCAGSTETFDVYVWAIQTGYLVQVLAGHEAPVSGISFCPMQAVLVSSSWDKTVRVWDVFESKGSRETITLNSDGLTVVFRPDGLQFAVATLDGQISFFNLQTSQQLGTIEGRNDLYVGRRETDAVTAKKLVKAQAFTSLCYTAGGDCLLAAGKSKYICIYNVAEQMLMKKFEVTCNLSFDAVEDYINRRRMTEFGNKALIEKRADSATQAIALPGTKKIDMSSRTNRPEIIVSSVQFSPTGRAWAATTTEGLLVYSLDSNLIFDPYELDLSITPQTIRKTLKEKDFSKAVVMAFKLNETKLIVEALESVPLDNIPTLISYLPHLYIEKLLRFLGSQLETSRHLEFYMTWIQSVLMNHGLKLKERSSTLMDAVHTLQKNLTQHFTALGKICDHNRYSIEFLLSMQKSRELSEPEVLQELSADYEMEDHSDPSSILMS